MKATCYRWHWFVLILSLSGNAVAANQPHSEIMTTAKSFLQSAFAQSPGEIQVQINAPDHRLALPECSKPLQAFSTQDQPEPGANTVGIRCAGKRPWTIYLSASVRLFLPVAVARSGLSRGQDIQANDLIMQRMDVSSLRTGYITDAKAPIGQVVKRPIRTGSVVYQRSLDDKQLVERGDQVRILATTQGFQVSMKGIAMDSGSKGELIEVKNAQSKRIIQARVVETGLVQVRL